MNNKEDVFRYTYSAAEQTEVERIRSKYLPREESKLEQLRRLDRRATRKAQIWSLTAGILGALLLGTGMSLCMTALPGLSGVSAMLVGIPVGLAGMAVAALAYPLYNRILRRERGRIAPEILRLSEELMK